MRPLTLTIEGLRSWRRRQTIDFSDVDLAAIIGDTGAGKSSILEALCLALYAASTWSQREVRTLISDGATNMQVELCFRADGADWRITRQMPRGAYPPAIHKLECLTDGVSFDGAAAVNAEAERLVGLNFEEFKRAVVLPQGSFAALLHATAADRTSILKGILRLDQLDAVRELSRSIRETRISPQLQQVELRRAILRPDPAADASAHADGERLATEQAERLQKAVETAVGVRGEIAKHRATIATAERQIELVERHDRNALATDAVALRERADELAAARATLASSLATTTQRREALREETKRDEAAGRGASALTAADTLLSSFIQARTAAEIERAQHDVEASATEQELHAISAAEGALAASEAELVASQPQLAILETALEEADARTEAVRRAIAEKDASQVATSAAEDHWRGLREDVEALGDKVAEASRLEQQAATALARTREQRDAVHREDAAAHLAAHLVVGDLCPVCAHVLPATFVAPMSSESVEGADAALQEAEDANTRATEVRSATSARLAAAVLARDQATSELEKIRVEAELAASTVRTLTEAREGRPAMTVPAVEELAVAASLALRTGREAEAHLRFKISGLNAELPIRRRDVDRRAQQLSSARAASEQRPGAALAAAVHVPEAFRPSVNDSDEQLELLAAKLRDALAAVARVTSDLRAVEEEQSNAQRDLDNVGSRIIDEVDQPQRVLRDDALGLRAAVATAASELGLDPPSLETSVDGGVDDLSALVVSVTADAVQILAVAQEIGPAILDEIDSCHRSVDRVLADSGYESEEALGVALEDAAFRRRDHQARRVAAEAEIEPALLLDTTINDARSLVDALRETERLLTDGQFIGFVVTKRQRSLLAVASDLLTSMSSGRYGFADDFQVVDRISGQARGARTLSGGEAFLASLALALALVELAQRGGGKLDALFLDEGFGSLDANALEEALEALSRQSGSGRLVAVISHVKAVAEALEHVLVVAQKDGSSEAHWASAPERDALAIEDAESALLT